MSMSPNPVASRGSRVATRALAKNLPTALAAALSLALAAALALGCGGRTLYGGWDGGTNNANTNQNANANTNNNANQNTNTNTNQNNNNGECQKAEDCVVAIKDDVCCACPVSASPADLAADPCLRPIDSYDWPDGCYPGPCPPDLCTPCATWGRTPDCQSGQCVFKEGRCTEDDQCVVAIRTDNCCEMAFVASRSDVEADPCLEYWSGYWYDAPAECMEKWDPECAYIDCMPSPPPSRASTCSPEGCIFAPECQDERDCLLLVNQRECCPCPSAWPKLAVGRDPCVTPFNSGPPPADCRPSYCENIACDACPDHPGVACDPDWGCFDNWSWGP